MELYLTDIRPLAGREETLAACLDEARKARLAAYRMQQDRLRCIAAGLLLRRSLGAQAAADIRIGPYGKPFLLNGPCFNLSHTGDYVLLAVHDTEVGVDIERVRQRDPLRLAQRFFHPAECAAVESAADRMEMFCRIWTLKESYIKADGRGFAIRSSSYCILPKGDGARMIGDGGAHFRCYRWDGDYRIAVCARDDAFPDAPTEIRF